MAALMIIVGLILAIAGIGNIIAATTSDEWARGNERLVYFGIGFGLVLFFPGLLLFIYGVKRAGRSSTEHGNTRKCPFCAEMVKPEAAVCRHCQRELPTDRTDQREIAIPAPSPPWKLMTCPHCKEPIRLNPGDSVCYLCHKEVAGQGGRS